MLEKEFIPYQQALALKELGFDEPCFKAYDSKGVLQKCTSDYWDISSLNIINEATTSNLKVLAPTFSQAFYFFRNKYGLMHIINPYDFTAEINYLNKRVVNDVYGDFIPHDHLVDDEGEEIKHLSYEEAENACLLELINICKKK
jgi:hypothetical protein